MKPSLPGSESYTVLGNDLAEGQVACVSKCAIELGAANCYSRASPSMLVYRDSRILSESRRSGHHMVVGKENGGEPNFVRRLLKHICNRDLENNFFFGNWHIVK